MHPRPNITPPAPPGSRSIHRPPLGGHAGAAPLRGGPHAPGGLQRPPAQEAASGDPDVLLDVPNLSVEEINLEVQNLRVHVALDARLANLLQLSAGADASIDSVKLTIRGVRAEVLLKVRLDNVAPSSTAR